MMAEGSDSKKGRVGLRIGEFYIDPVVYGDLVEHLGAGNVKSHVAKDRLLVLAQAGLAVLMMHRGVEEKLEIQKILDANQGLRADQESSFSDAVKAQGGSGRAPKAVEKPQNRPAKQPEIPEVPAQAPNETRISGDLKTDEGGPDRAPTQPTKVSSAGMTTEGETPEAARRRAGLARRMLDRAR